jgi:hypothetical protein
MGFPAENLAISIKLEIVDGIRFYKDYLQPKFLPKM